MKRTSVKAAIAALFTLAMLLSVAPSASADTLLIPLPTNPCDATCVDVFIPPAAAPSNGGDIGPAQRRGIGNFICKMHKDSITINGTCYRLAFSPGAFAFR